MYVRERCSVPSGATPYPEGWAARETARTILPLSLALARANRAMSELIRRPDMEARGFTRGSPRAMALQRVAGLPLARVVGPQGRVVLCRPEAVSDEKVIPPGPISTALPAVTLEGMNFCDELQRGLISQRELTAEKLRECAAAGYVGVAASPGTVRMAALAVASGLTASRRDAERRYPMMAASTVASHGPALGALMPEPGEAAARAAWGMLAAGLFLIFAWPKR